MGQAIGQILPIGFGVALSPLPIIAVVLMLGTPRARRNGLAFMLGWLLGLAVVGTVVILAAGGADASDDGEPAGWLSWTKLVLGLLLLAMAVKSWRDRPVGDEPARMPAWMQALDGFSAINAAGLGAALSGISPKNLMLTLGAGTAIAQTGITTGQQFIVLALYVVVGAVGPGLPVAIYLALGDRAEHPLSTLKATMIRHNAAMMAVLLAALGLKIIGDAIAGLS